MADRTTLTTVNSADSSDERLDSGTNENRDAGKYDDETDDLEAIHAHADPARDAQAEAADKSTGDQIGGQSSHSEDAIKSAGGNSNHPETGRPNISDTSGGWGVSEQDKTCNVEE